MDRREEECSQEPVPEWTKQNPNGDDLPPLTGSPKQVAWAESIRADTIMAPYHQQPEYLPAIAAIIRHYLPARQAKFWRLLLGSRVVALEG
jgi:hypothetical protein